MFKGSVDYKADGSGVAFAPMSIQTHVPNTGGATLSATKDEVSLRVEITRADAIGGAIGGGADVAACVASVMTYYFDRYFKGFRHAGHALVEEQEGAAPVQHLGTTMAFKMTADSCLQLGPSAAAELKAALDRPHRAGYIFYDQFRAALALSDPVARFMSLYNIVLSLCSDSQEDVDALALQLDAGTPTNTPFRPRRSGIPETVYTRLRNQIGHVRPGTTIEGTRAEMSTWQSGLVRMTKELINRQP